LDEVSVDLFPGEILGLVGANGSGKTTLASILSGKMTPDSGEIWVQGNPVSFGSPADAVASGVRILPQHLELYPSMSILENIFIGQEMTRSFPLLRLMAWARMREVAKTLLSRVGADDSIEPRAAVSRLSGGQQKAVILARLLARKANVLVFDESMASLGISQKTRLLEIFASEAADGRSIVFVSHDIQDVLSVCSRVSTHAPIECRVGPRFGPAQTCRPTCGRRYQQSYRIRYGDPHDHRDKPHCPGAALDQHHRN
jgi:ABC-type sugar transport system ATPase subunit